MPILLQSAYGQVDFGDGQPVWAAPTLSSDYAIELSKSLLMRLSKSTSAWSNFLGERSLRDEELVQWRTDHGIGHHVLRPDEETLFSAIQRGHQVTSFPVSFSCLPSFRAEHKYAILQIFIAIEPYGRQFTIEVWDSEMQVRLVIPSWFLDWSTYSSQ
jgi:hypothetical protein